MSTNERPVLKWAGGKRTLINQISVFFPKEYGTYIEPFLGGGSVLLSVKPVKAIVSDNNEELMNLYCIIRDNPFGLIESLKVHEYNHSKEYYYKIRSLDRSEDYDELSPLERASRIVYLNHTCYNGLYRVNTKGLFNTPIGKYKNPKICDEEAIKYFSTFLNKKTIKLLCNDYKESLKLAKKGDFVYLDPPYDILVENSFTMYTKEGFSKSEQVRLKEQCDKLSKKGILFAESNSDTPFIRELYKNYRIEVISANRNINSKGKERKKINELLIMNY